MHKSSSPARGLVSGAALLLALCIPGTSRAQGKFHFDVDYHYALGLRESFPSGHFGRDYLHMGGHSIRFTGRYDVARRLSTGVGFGWDRYTQDDYNTLPLMATLRYKPLRGCESAYVFTDLGYGIRPKDTYTSGFVANLGLGYTWMLAPHFGLNFQLAYNYKALDDAYARAILGGEGMPVDYELLDARRHSLWLGIGMTF